MTKWICKSCVRRFPCVIDAPNVSYYEQPAGCVFDTDNKCNWQRYDEKENKPATECSRLPKLTAEVFDRPDCPKWAKFAALGGGGGLAFYEDKPRMSKDEYPKRWINYDRWYPVEGIKFDSSDWQNSLIERPALPEWCKVGEWVWLDPEKIIGSTGYKKVKSIEGLGLNFTDGGCVFFSDRIKPARLRPWTFEEAPLFVKVKKTDGKLKILELLIDTSNKPFYRDKCHNDMRLDVVAEIYTQLDGKPCGVLKHLENGEWVE